MYHIFHKKARGVSQITVKFITLGCKTNFYESEALSQLFTDAGYTVTNEKCADILIINTCTVTGTGAAKSRKLIRKARRENPNAVLAVMGCLSQTEPESLKTENIDVLIGNKHRDEIVSLCEAALCGKKTEKIENILKETEFEELGIVHRQSRIRAEIKIEDGCNNFCSYCKIPYARGPVRSRSLDNIKKEAAILSNCGEIVLTGIHIGSYGKDLNDGTKLIDVIEAVAESSNVKRLRLGSLEPVMIDEEFVRRASKLKNLCPQFHLSLQSGCDNTLKAMRRRYSTDDFRTAVKNLRSSFLDVAITTDLIVGFPGETEADFEASKAFCEEIGFSQMHIFPYSKREGTIAATLPNQVDENEKNRRTHIMLDLAANMKEDFYKRYIGRTLPVLFEQKKGNLFIGYTPNYMEVRATSDKDLCGKCADAKILSYDRENEYLAGIAL